jgi:putative transcriptional regulator
MGKFFEDLKEGLEEILAYKEGKITLKSEFIEIPEPPSLYTAQEVKNIREKCNYSQAMFAMFLNVSVKTIQAWESGERIPNHASLRLLELVDKEIYLPFIQRTRPAVKAKCKEISKTRIRRRKSKELQNA